MLDIYFAKEMPKIKRSPIILKLKNGEHEGKRRIHKFRTKHVELEFEEEITFNVDRKKLTGNNFIIDVIPNAITLFNDNDLVKEVMN